MSSEHAIHLGDKQIEPRVFPLDGLPCVVASLRVEDENRNARNTEVFTLYIKEDRLVELADLFYRVGRDLDALIPDHDHELDRADADFEAGVDTGRESKRYPPGY